MLSAALAITALTTTAMADTTAIWPDCPSNPTSAPAIATFGPYAIEDFGTAEAIAYSLPNCLAVGQVVQIMMDATMEDDVAQVTALPDGTYEVGLVVSQ